MGKKYIIELEDKPVCVFDEDTQTFFPRLHRVKGFNSLVFDQNGLDKLTPYTEPDTNEVYQRGVEDGAKSVENWNEQEKKLRMDEAYQNGISDMRDALKLIEKAECVDDLVSLGFDVETAGGWSKAIELLFEKYSPSEIIEKIRQYEQKQEKKDGVWIASEANKLSVDTTLICSKCGYAIKIKPHETPALNFCPKCGDCKKPKEEES